MSPLLKLCGNHSAEDVDVAYQSSADYIGFVFAKSKRQVKREDVQKWMDQYENRRGKKLVALFVHAETDEIIETIKGLPFDVIQCHGNELPEQVADIKERTGLSVWKVIHHSEEALRTMKEYEGTCDGYVIDCKVGNQWGGTGVSFDWEFVPLYIEEGKRQQVPVFIAGGINPDNIEELLAFNPDGVDLSSGIEENGQKSSKLVSQLEERMNWNGNDVPR